jgi:transposase
MRIAWRTVGGIISRVAAEAEDGVDRFRCLRRIGIDEISYRKGHRYLTVVVDHDRGRLLWAKAGNDTKTLEEFFRLLGPERSARIELVSADGASWIRTVVKRRCPNAKLCLDPFHVVSWATDALDEIRREVWNEARSEGLEDEATELKGARFALWKNPENLTPGQHNRLASIAKTNRPLYRGYLLKEELRLVFKLKGKRGQKLLKEWLEWARRCRLGSFVELGRKIRRHQDAIDDVLETGLSNAIVESMNCKIRVLTRQAFGFHSPEALVGMAMLALGGLCPDLPGRA